MLQLRHPHIVQLVGACHHEGLPMLAFEYLDGGSLNDYIHEVIKSKLDHGSFFTIARDIILALNFLHNQTNPIIHMDIKSANILLDTYLRAKVADLGKMAPFFANLQETLRNNKISSLSRIGQDSKLKSSKRRCNEIHRTQWCERNSCMDGTGNV